ncbi:MAG: hypothetical protein ACXV5C_00005 [Halobacteriota archaeon]
MDSMPSPKAELTFSIDGSSNVWRLLGVHPRFGPSWALVTQDNRAITHEIKGVIGEIFKIASSDFDYTFVTIAEGGILKEINYIVFEDFAYSISRRWYNILKNTGKFMGRIHSGD